MIQISTATLQRKYDEQKTEEVEVAVGSEAVRLVTSMREAYIDIYYQSHASDTGVTVSHENDPCPMRQAQQLELSHRATLRHRARFIYQV